MKINEEIKEFIVDYKNSEMKIQCVWKETSAFLERAVKLLKKIADHENK